MKADLSQLHGLSLPPEPSWWPLALGYWLLLALLCSGLLTYWFNCHYLPRRRARRTLQQLQVLAAEQQWPALSLWLRRWALTRGGRNKVAGLTGQAWLDWLQQQQPKRPLPSAFQHLLQAPYQANPVAVSTECWLWAQQLLSLAQPKPPKRVWLKFRGTTHV